jgi:PAS domain-containing protein
VPIKVRGEVRHVLEFFSPKIALPDPELLQTLSAISNQLGQLVERKGAEEALRASETRKAAILQSALDCIVSYEDDGTITEWNPAAERTSEFGRRTPWGGPSMKSSCRSTLATASDALWGSPAVR